MPALADRTQEFAGRFDTTQWDVVFASAQTQVPGADHALTDLCRTYWPPLYAYVRRRGYSAADAEDLVQDFFAQFLENRAVKKADPLRGRFRTFMLGSLSNFLANDWDRATAEKRGGKFKFVPFDLLAAEERDATNAHETTSAEIAFDLRWARAILDTAVRQLRDEAAARGKTEMFDTLQPFLVAAEATTYESAAAKLNLPTSAVKTAIHRLRANFRVVVRREVARTVGAPTEVKDELRYLRSVLAAAPAGPVMGC